MTPKEKKYILKKLDSLSYKTYYCRDGEETDIYDEIDKLKSYIKRQE